MNGYNEFKDKIKIPQYDIIIDNPYEKEEDIIKTLMFLLKLPTPYQLSLYYLTFYPGTDLYKKAINDGIITNEQKEIYQKNYKKSKDENKDYLKNLLVLLSKYSSNGVSISPSIMNYLTNPKARRYYLHLPVYVSLKIKVILLKRIGHFNYILKEALKDIKTGNWFRIRAYVKKYFIRFN